MATSIASGRINPSIDGLTVTYTDTGTYNPPVTSRILTVFDADNNLVTTVNMGVSLTATINITFDQWLSFHCVVVDSTGTFTAIVDWLAEIIAINAILNRTAATDCICKRGELCDIFKAQLSVTDAEWFSLFGLGISADKAITAANVYANTNNNINF